MPKLCSHSQAMVTSLYKHMPKLCSHKQAMVTSNYKHMPKLCSLSHAMETSLYEKTILKRDAKQYTVNQLTKRKRKRGKNSGFICTGRLLQNRQIIYLYIYLLKHNTIYTQAYNNKDIFRYTYILLYTLYRHMNLIAKINKCINERKNRYVF